MRPATSSRLCRRGLGKDDDEIGELDLPVIVDPAAVRQLDRLDRDRDLPRYGEHLAALDHPPRGKSRLVPLFASRHRRSAPRRNGSMRPYPKLRPAATGPVGKPFSARLRAACLMLGLAVCAALAMTVWPRPAGAAEYRFDIDGSGAPDANLQLSHCQTK